MYFTYGIYNPKNKKVYIGQCKNIQERMKMHHDKIFFNSYTARFDGEWILIYSEEVETRKEALVREKQLKSYRERQFIKNFIPR